MLVGPNSIAGEWGHNPLPWMTPDEFPGPPCYCGKHGLHRDLPVGPRRWRATTSGPPGRRWTRRPSWQQAAAGDSAAEATLVRYEDRMARALASILNVLDPDVVVLGGGLSQDRAPVRERPQAVGHAMRSPTPWSPAWLPPRHGDASGVRGAAWLWPAEIARATAS